MAQEEEDEPEEEGGGEWMATFADLSMLLLTFFVLLLSFSTMDVVQFREMLGSVRDAFGVQKQIQGSIEAIASSPVELSMNQNDGAGMAPPHEQEKDPNQEMMEEMSKYVENEDMTDDVEVELTPRGVIVRVKEGALYSSGKAVLDEKSKEVLDKIADMHSKYADSVQIEGHTDNIPMKSKKYPSNWELSADRAITAMKYMRDEGGVEGSKIGVAGYADAKPIDSNDTPEGRNKNRRVEFVFSRAPKKEEGAEGGGADKGEEEDNGKAFPIPMSGGGG